MMVPKWRTIPKLFSGYPGKNSVAIPIIRVMGETLFMRFALKALTKRVISATVSIFSAYRYLLNNGMLNVSAVFVQATIPKIKGVKDIDDEKLRISRRTPTAVTYPLPATVPNISPPQFLISSCYHPQTMDITITSSPFQHVFDLVMTGRPLWTLYNLSYITTYPVRMSR